MELINCVICAAATHQVVVDPVKRVRVYRWLKWFLTIEDFVNIDETYSHQSKTECALEMQDGCCYTVYEHECFRQMNPEYYHF